MAGWIYVQNSGALEFPPVWVSVPRLLPFQGWHSPSGPLLAAAMHLRHLLPRNLRGPHSLRGRWWWGSRYFPSRGGTNGHPASPAIIALTLDALCKLSLLLSGRAAQGERRSGASWGGGRRLALETHCSTSKRVLQPPAQTRTPRVCTLSLPQTIAL